MGDHETQRGTVKRSASPRFRVATQSAVGDDPISAILEITFRTSGTYAYFGVPQAQNEALMAAGPKGTYFAYHIKYRYVTRKR
jgi:hypothetical protein